MGILWYEDAGHPVIAEDKQSLSSSIRHIVQELQWTIPGIRFGIVADPNNASFASSNFCSRDAIRFQSAVDGYEPLDFLEWLCGVDAWLILDASPLAKAFRELAADLRIPCFSTSTGNVPTIKGRWYETVCAIEKALELRFTDQAILAFRTSDRNPGRQDGRDQALTAESALQILRSALRKSEDRTPKSEIIPCKTQVRRAA